MLRAKQNNKAMMGAAKRKMRREAAAARTAAAQELDAMEKLVDEQVIGHARINM